VRAAPRRGDGPHRLVRRVPDLAFILALVAGVAAGLYFFVLAEVSELFQRLNTLLES